MPYQLLDTVVLERDLPLRKGDPGAIVEIYRRNLCASQPKMSVRSPTTT